MLVETMTVTSDTHLELDVVIAEDAEPTTRSLAVVHPGNWGPNTGGAGACWGCFAVSTGGGAD